MKIVIILYDEIGNICSSFLHIQHKKMYTYIGVYRGIILMAAGNAAADDCDKEYLWPEKTEKKW